MSKISLSSICSSFHTCVSFWGILALFFGQPPNNCDTVYLRNLIFELICGKRNLLQKKSIKTSNMFPKNILKIIGSIEKNQIVFDNGRVGEGGWKLCPPHHQRHLVCAALDGKSLGCNIQDSSIQIRRDLFRSKQICSSIYLCWSISTHFYL